MPDIKKIAPSPASCLNKKSKLTTGAHSTTQEWLSRIKKPARDVIAKGKSISVRPRPISTPKVTATAFPPLNLRNGENAWPKIAAIPIKSNWFSGI